jgi:hypothetical protein
VRCEGGAVVWGWLLPSERPQYDCYAHPYPESHTIAVAAVPYKTKLLAFNSRGIETRICALRDASKTVASLLTLRPCVCSN